VTIEIEYQGLTTCSMRYWIHPILILGSGLGIGCVGIATVISEYTCNVVNE
jgi:Na+-driven multidrug efflux pump